MKNVFLVVVVCSSAALPVNTYAAKPISIRFESEDTTGGNKRFSNYTVKCSNGALQLLTAWHKRKQWCIGKQSTINCHEQQIKAAKKACNT